MSVYSTNKQEFSISWGWIFFLIVLSAWLVFGMSSIVGTIGGILGIIAFLGQGCRWWSEWNRSRNPLIVTFSHEARENIRQDSDMPSKIKLPIGETRILLRIRTRLLTDFTETTIRPENKNRESVFPEGMEPLRIEKVEVVDDKSPRFEPKYDNVGGVKLFYDDLFERPQDARIHYYLTIKATKKWKGKLMVEARVNDKRRHSRGDIEVVSD